MRIQESVIPFAGCFATDSEAQRSSRLVFAGLPDDSQSSYRRGCAQGPSRIRQAYDGHCFNATTESGVDLTGRVTDLGDWPPHSTWPSTIQSYRQLAESILLSEKIPFFTGGDHAVTVPIGEALSVLGEPIHIVQIDAHPDLYPEFEGNPDSHACVAARLLEMDHVASITQIGVRTLNRAQSQQVERYQDRLHIVFAREATGELTYPAHLHEGAPVYLTVDLDGFDPAFAPGVSHPVPGGLSPRQALNFIQHASWRLVGMDVVELNPEVDVNDQTAILAAKLLHEGMGHAVKAIAHSRQSGVGADTLSGTASHQPRPAHDRSFPGRTTG